MQSLELNELKDQFQSSLEKGKSALEKKALREKFLKRYGHSDPYFIDQQIEALSFLQKEQSDLRASINHPAIVKRDSLAARLQFILSDENKISFAEQNIRTSKDIKETEEKQRYPVQIDEEDLKELLSLIEDVPIGKYNPAPHLPQLLIQNFQIHRHTTPIETEVFIVEMSLLKREFNL